MAFSATTAMPTTSAPTEALSSFTKLPMELRLAIYRLLIDNMIDEFLSTNDTDITKSERPKCYGVIALLLTNKFVQAELAREMLPPVHAEWTKLRARLDILFPERNQPIGKPPRVHYEDDFIFDPERESEEETEKARAVAAENMFRCVRSMVEGVVMG